MIIANNMSFASELSEDSRAPDRTPARRNDNRRYGSQRDEYEWGRPIYSHSTNSSKRQVCVLLQMLRAEVGTFLPSRHVQSCDAIGAITDMEQPPVFG